MKKLLLILLCIPLLVLCQDEKRLALVIGNANYDKGELKNPVNDALLIANTLDDLGFDVLLDTNIATREGFIRKIREFGDKRPEYDIAFVYYAGHGIQVGTENFLLPTKINFESEDDVLDFGVSVQNIMRYLTVISDQVNILVLDACRDNPFEGNWNATRSLKRGGLAKIPPPTGSLIAFSTDVGNTAADGDGNNSIYCLALCKYLSLPDITINGVFNNVRTSVKKSTNGSQIPVELSKLEGGDFYFSRNKKINDTQINRFIIEDFLKEYYRSIESNNLSSLKSFYKDTVEFFFSRHNITSDKIIKISERHFSKFSKRKHYISWDKLNIHDAGKDRIYLSYEMKYLSTDKKSGEEKKYDLRLFIKLDKSSLKIYSIYEVFL